ncbi:6-phosphogluconate dehydrogenase [Microdochium bolleyi]|uniref:6-phosphogluconate dehydrogenase n=1 Tax=Microdochium bolleyi TaxID=196109 RepID=A0A136IXW5_9PEZI|nr:6-phosphogluconate dehydrogenase [Microdochium bolleyi]
MASITSSTRLTMAILGCGNMGIAILRGVMTSQQQIATSGIPAASQTHTQQQQHGGSMDATAGGTSSSPPAPFFTRFIACVNRPESVAALQSKIPDLNNGGATLEQVTVDVWQGRTLEAVQAADVVLLSCQPSQAAGILAGPDMARALQGKVLLSICVGLALPQLESMIQYPDGGAVSQSQRCVLVHAMPNTASTVRESSTIIAEYPGQHATPASTRITEHIFSSIGRVIRVTHDLMPAASVTAASTPAFFALALQGVVDGAVAKGIPREQATVMAAQAMKGAACIVLERGEAPEEVMEKVMTPGGCTERGVRVLQAEKVGQVYADATEAGIERVFEMSRERAAAAAAATTKTA